MSWEHPPDLEKKNGPKKNGPNSIMQKQGGKAILGRQNIHPLKYSVLRIVAKIYILCGYFLQYVSIIGGRAVKFMSLHKTYDNHTGRLRMYSE
jgi:hypothetical protein